MNMSYCRFENTLRALEDCNRHMDETKDLSAEEKKARTQLILLCAQIYEESIDEVEGGTL